MTNLIWEEIFEQRLIEEIKAELDDAQRLADRQYGGQERTEITLEFLQHMAEASRRIATIVERVADLTPKQPSLLEEIEIHFATLRRRS